MDVIPSKENDFYSSFAELEDSVGRKLRKLNRHLAYAVVSDELTGIKDPSRSEHPWLIVQFDENDEFCTFVVRTTTAKARTTPAPNRIGSLKHTDLTRVDQHACDVLTKNGWYYFSYITSSNALFKPSLEQEMRRAGKKFTQRVQAISINNRFCLLENKDAREQFLACLAETRQRVGIRE